MKNVSSLLGILLTAYLIRLAIRKIPYFNRPDVAARRAVKARLPVWVSSTQLLFLVISEATLIALFFKIEIYVHGMFHPGSQFVVSQPNSSLDSPFAWVELIAPIAAALPLGMILANLISWSVPAIRKAEDIIMGEGVPGYNWKALNVGLFKAAAVMIPVSIILALISLFRL